MPVEWRGTEIGLKVQLAAQQGIARGTEGVRNEAIRLILDTPKTGRLYPRRSGKVHQASGPDEPPASDTGTLVRNIRTDFSRLDRLIGVVTASTEYAAHLEFGTMKMEPRPFMRPALANSIPAIERAVWDSIRVVLQ